MIEQRIELPTIELQPLREKRFREAYLEFYGINHLRPSYMVWIFITNKLPKNVTAKSRGFAGTFAVFGHAKCWGSAGHCHGADGLRRFDSRASHAMTPAFKRVPITHALQKKLSGRSKSLKMHLYAYSREAWDDQADKSLLSCSGVQLVLI